MAIFHRRPPEAPPAEPMLRMGAGGQMLPYQGGMGQRPETLPAPDRILAPGGAMLGQPIGKDQVREAMNTLRKYKAGKANMERRVIEDEEWWKLRHWNFIPERGTTQLKTKSAWLINVILSKHADAMDAFPEPNCLPRAADDEEEARRLSSVLPVVFEQNDFEHTWSENWWKKLKSGMAIYGVFWDKDKLNGMGDISVRTVDPLNLFWEPGIRELQKSRNIFHVELWDNEVLKERYPGIGDRQLTKDIVTSKYLYDDNVDTSNKSPVVDWYYKKAEGGRSVLHYVKFVGETVLYATENEADMQNGLYDHGLYPFFADVLFPEEGTPAGYGYIDICKDAQRQIDLMNNAIVANTIACATPRWFKRGDGGINEEEFADWTRPFVHVQGSLDETGMRQIQVNAMPGNLLSVLDGKITELKEITGNRDVNNGGTASGVTAASAIAAMQEQSGKLSRDQIQNSYRCFRQVVGCVIALIRQFYDTPRKLRITGPTGEPEFLRFDNSLLGSGEPTELDIEVTAQKQSTYNKLSYNEMAMQFFQMGFFRPELADQALAALEMMDFKGRDALRRRLAENAALRERLARTEAQLQSLLDLIGPGEGSGIEDQGSGEENARGDASVGAVIGRPPEAAGSRERENAETARRDGTLPSGSRSERSPAGRSPEAPRKQAPRLRAHAYDVIGSELRKNRIAEQARARAAAATQPR